MGGLPIGSGNGDILIGASSSEIIVGGRGNDTVRGEHGEDTLIGSEGDDELHGGAGHDLLDGGTGNDILYGDSGADILIAGSGNDTLVGGAEGDAFVIDATNSALTTIRDFSVADGDFIVIKTPDGQPVEFTQVLNPQNGSLQVNFTSASDPKIASFQLVIQNFGRLLDHSRNEMVFKASHEALVLSNEGKLIPHRAATAVPIWVTEWEPPQFLRKGIGGDAYHPLYEIDRKKDGKAYDEFMSYLRSARVVVFDSSVGAAKVRPGERIVIVRHISEDRTYFAELGPEVLEATWDGIKSSSESPTGLELRHLIQSIYSNGGQPTDISRATWSVDGARSGILGGTYEADYLQVKVPSENRPLEVDLDRWNDALSRLPKLDVFGWSGRDSLVGSYLSENMHGGADDDTLRGGAGDDTLNGGTGDDVLEGGAGNDALIGGEGKDTFRFTAENGVDRIEDLSTDDIVHFENGGWTTALSYHSASPDGFYLTGSFDFEEASSVDFRISVGLNELKAKNHVLYSQLTGGGELNEVALRGDSISESRDLLIQHQLDSVIINALGGDDIVYSLNNAGLRIDAGDGDDSVFALSGGNEIHGGQGNDVIYSYETHAQGVDGDQLWGGDGQDKLTGANLNDVLHGGNDRDHLNGGGGDDTLHGGDDSDTLDGGRGDDILYGGSGDDVLVDSHGNDLLDGGDGDDIFINGHGRDTFIGGAGDDEFYMAHVDGAPDTVNLDKNSGNDTIVGLAGNDTLQFIDVLSIPTLSLKQNGAEVVLSWGANSVSLYSYSLSASIEIHLSNGEVLSGRLMDIFRSNGYNPDGLFEFLNGKDLQTKGNTAISTVKEGSDADDELETIPSNDHEAAYSYILGRGGNDKLAGGASGAVIDPGSGANLVLVTNELTLTKDTRQPGKTSLVFQPGVTADQLRFTRVLNPASWAVPKSNTSTAAQSQTGYTKPSPLFNPFDNKILESDAAVFSISGPNNLYHSEISFDTLRVETLNGRYKVDIVGYFSSTSPNVIDEFIFTTEFDENGYSKRYLAKDLIDNPRQARVHRFIDNYRSEQLLAGGLAVDRMPSLRYESGRGSNKGVYTTQDGEAGQILNGTVSWMIGQWDRNSAYGARLKTVYGGDPALRTSNSAEYQRFKAKMLNPSQVFRILPAGEGGNQVRTWEVKSGEILDFPASYIEVSSYLGSPRLIAISRSDVIYGNGGNDTIQAGGAYYEDLNLETGVVERTNPWDLNNRVFAGQGDWVNGGAGDDTYVYRKGDGTLRIFHDLSETGGAGGVDRLDLTDYKYSDAYFVGGSNSPIVSATGAMTIWLPGGGEQYIYIGGGGVGEIQVDFIDFSDRSVSVRELMTDQGHAFKSDLELGVSYTPMHSASSDLGAISPTVSGSPGADKILVRDKKYYTGHEGLDFYVIDPDVQFAVVQMDTGDFILPPDDQMLAGAWALEGLPDDATYLGRTSAQWLELGVLPYGGESAKNLRDYYSFSDYYYSSGLTSNISFQGFMYFLGDGKTIEFGTYDRSVNDGQLTLENWTALSGKHERFHDAKITWSTSVNGVKKEHTLIALDVIPADGLRTAGVNEWLQLGWGIGTAGDDSGSLVYGREGNDNITASRGGEESSWTNYQFPHNVEDYAIAFGGSGNDTVNAALDEYDRGSILHGDSGDDLLVGGVSGDTLFGGAGTDTLLGGLGDDVYIVDEFDTIEDSGGFDEVITYADFVLADGIAIEKVTAAGWLPISISGNGDNNVLESNGFGVSMKGGGGDDTYIVIGGADLAVEYAGEGIDLIVTALKEFVLPEYVENLQSIGLSGILVGNRLDNIITGDSGANHIDGQVGADTMRGLEGDDTYYVDHVNDLIIEESGGGFDTVIYRNSLASRATIQNVEKFVAGSPGNFVIYGNELSNVMVGGYGGDIVYAGSGNDTLDGGRGADTLFGGPGDDTYVVDSEKDVVVELAGEGEFDAVRILYSGSYDLRGTAIENIVAEGGALYATGNSSGNRIVGGDGDDTLYGMEGNDTLVSGGGYERLYGGEGEDTYEIDLMAAAGVEISANERDGDALIIKGVDSVSNLLFRRGELAWYEENGRPFLKRAAGNHLEIGLVGGNGQSIVVYDYFNTDGSNSGVLARITIGGTALSVDDVKAALPNATSGDDLLYGYDLSESISGLDGDDFIDGAGGFDTLLGGGGNDVIIGAGRLEGGDGSDSLFLMDWQSNASSILSGGAGDDVLNSYEYGHMRALDSAASVLDGGTGNDTYLLHKYDRALHRVGEGADVVKSHAYAGSSELRMEGLKLSELLLARTSGSNNLVVATRSGLHSDQVTVESYFSKSTSNRLKVSVLNEAGTGYVVLSDATIASMSNVGNELNNSITGTNNGESLSGLAGDDVIKGQGGNDQLIGGEGNDSLYGGAGNDGLVGGEGNDYLDDSNGIDRFEGGSGNDSLIGGGGGDVYDGGAGDDTYWALANSGAGNLTIIDTDATVGNQDTLILDTSPYSLLFKQAGNDLLVTRMDAGNSFTVKNWFSGASHQVEIIQTQVAVDDYTSIVGRLKNTAVQQLVQAMADFAPSAGQTQVAETTNSELHQTIRSVWGVQHV